MNAQTIAEARTCWALAHESALEFLTQELLEDRPLRITISRRIATLLREREATRKRLKPPPPGHHSRRSQPNSRSRTEGLSVPSRSTSTLSGYARCFQTARRAPDAAGDSASSCACTRNTTLSCGPVARSLRHRSPGSRSSGKGGSCSGRLRALQRSPTGRCAARGEAGRVLRAQGGSGGPGGAA